MAAATYLTEDQFRCSICLDVFTDPVSTSCGHNFCKGCITEHWNTSIPWKCPLCKKVFDTKPELRTNIFISEMVSQYRESAQPTHWQPHLTASSLKRYQLINPVENLEGRMCMKHDKPLELFCRTDQTSVCMLCICTDHKMHDVVPLEEGYEGKKVELEAEIQEIIQERQFKINTIKWFINISNQNAEKEIAEGVQVFTTLMQLVEICLFDITDTIGEKQRTTQKEAEDSIKELEQEISELKKRSTEVKKLSLSEDHLHLLQSFPSMEAIKSTRDWTRVGVCPRSYEGTVMRAVSQLEETLGEVMEKLVDEELKRVQTFAVDVTLDPDTANPHLILSGDGKQVNPGEVKKSLPNNPERFSHNPCVLAKQSFSSGRFYFEVQVKGKTEWDLGVARESINRKEDIPLSPEDGYWALWLRKRIKYKALNDPPVCLRFKSKPKTVGVFVDYEEGLVSFYDVEAAALIYSFTGCSFKEKLFPYFNPGLSDGGRNSAPLIISPVNHSE